MSKSSPPAIPARAVLSLVAFLSAAAVLSGLATGADVDVLGDWNVTGTEVYSNQVIQVHETVATNWTDGNLTVEAGGSLTLSNCTLILPWSSIFYVGGTLVLDNTTVDGPAWFLWMNGTTVLRNSRVVNATYSMNSTLREVLVTSLSTTLDRVTWTDANGNGTRIWMNVPLNFQGQVLEGGAGVHYMVDGSFANANIDISQNWFYNSSTVARYGVAVEGPAIPQPLSFDIHHNNFNRTLVGVGLLRVDDNTSYEVRDMYVNTTGFGTGIMPGVQGAGIRFKGNLNISNYTILNAYVGVWMWGAAPYDMVVNIDRMTAINVSYVLSIGGGFAEVRNSTFTATRTWIYEGLSQGHIRVYQTADTAFFATLPGTNATVEHLVWLPLTGATWQGGVPFAGQMVSLPNETGVLNLSIDPQTWAPQYAVQWGVYPGGLRVDNRDLRPEVVDGPYHFACTPAQFYMSDGMAPFSIQCTDDRAPVLSVSSPLANSYLNRSSFRVDGNMTEVGSGLAALELSVDNVSFSPVAPGANGSSAWSSTVGPLADGSYSVTVRASDRTGNIVYVTVFPIRIDTEVPVLVLGAGEPRDNSTHWLVTGSSEPFAQLTVRRSYGWNATVTLPADGRFDVLAPLDEGQNIFTIHVVDRAGNGFTDQVVVHLDTLAPMVAGLLDGMPVAALWTGNDTVRVSGACEAGTQVAVNGVSVSHAGSGFETDVALVPGRNDIDVSCTDSSLNSGHWYAFAFYDDHPPVLNATVDGGVVLQDGRFLVTSALVALAGYVFDAGSGVAAVSIGGNPVVVSGAGDLTVSVETPEGQTVVEVMAVDRVGNTATVTLTILRDSVAPTATFEWAPSGSPIVEVGGVMTTAGEQAALVVTLDEAATVALAGAIYDLPAGVSQLPLTLVSGPNQFTVSVQDAAGNGPPDTTVQINRDATAPEITIYTPNPDALLDVPAVEVAGKAEPGSSVKVGGRDVSVSATGEFHLFVDLQEGPNTITVDASDALGNTNHSSITVTYQAPAAPPTQAPAGGLEVPMLIVGLAAGIGAGAAIVRMKRRPPRRADAPLEVPSAGEPPEPEGGPPRGKGPRGPAPPP